jgi:hypothetical protein
MVRGLDSDPDIRTRVAPILNFGLPAPIDVQIVINEPERAKRTMHRTQFSIRDSWQLVA